MKERQPGCICELDDYGDPMVVHYPLCPVHKPDANTPKETANELVLKFSDDFAIDQGRHAALICVDEILDVLDAFQTHEYAKILIPYYQQVKEEINKL